jgi:transposase
MVEGSKVEATLQNKELKIFFQDEARFGRIDDLRRCWAPKGIRPILKKQIVREYTYSYGAVCPSDGDACFLVLPKLNQDWMSLMVKEMSERYPNNYLLIVCDGASAHKIGGEQLPGNVRLVFLPPYCPQLNPQENMWDDMREKFFYNVAFNSIDAVEDRLVEACNYYESNPEIVKSISSWNWILCC